MTSKRKIAIFTEFYPYGQGEEFLENEIKIAEKYFEDIAIITFNKNSKNLTKYVPKNATIFPIRKYIGKWDFFLKCLIGFFSLDVWKQTIICIRERGWSSFPSGLKCSVIEYSRLSVLIANEGRWAGQYDVYYSYWLTGLASYLALRKAHINGTIFSRTHGYDCFYERGFHAHRKEQFAYLDRIFTISEAGKADLIMQGCKPERIRTFRLGVIKPNDIINPYVKSIKKTIVTCSSIIKLKRLDLLVEALSMINDIEIHWVHFGDGVLKDSLVSLTKGKLGDKENITYDFKGWVSQVKILEFYQNYSIDLFLNCSDVEGIPVSIMEALSYGIPCIARDVGGNREIVSNDNGLLLQNCCSAEELKFAIIKLLTLSQERYITLRNNALNTYGNMFDANKNYTAFFEEMVNYNERKQD